VRWRRLLVVLLVDLWLVLAVYGPLASPPTCAATEGSLLSLIRHARGDRIATSPLLMKIAERRAHDIVTDYSHDGADRRFAEILVWNAYPEEYTEATAVRQWLDSPGHRAILLGNYNAIGVGVVDDGVKHFYAAVFARFKGGGSAPRLLPATDC
jgi:hypothetical protein